MQNKQTPNPPIPRKHAKKGGNFTLDQDIGCKQCHEPWLQLTARK